MHLHPLRELPGICANAGSELGSVIRREQPATSCVISAREPGLSLSHSFLICAVEMGILSCGAAMRNIGQHVKIRQEHVHANAWMRLGAQLSTFLSYQEASHRGESKSISEYLGGLKRRTRPQGGR